MYNEVDILAIGVVGIMREIIYLCLLYFIFNCQQLCKIIKKVSCLIDFQIDVFLFI